MKRNTQQYLIPEKKKIPKENTYDIYPAHPVSEGKIEDGYETLANRLAEEQTVILDGYVGVDWDEVIDALSSELKEKGKTVQFLDIKECLKPESDIQKMVEPFLGGDDPIFGFRTSLRLSDYFDSEKTKHIKLDDAADIQIIYGTGASQSGMSGFLVYFDLPKNELQYRMQAGEVTNLGFDATKDAKQMYKHFYFVDWVVLNKDKKRLLPEIDIIVDQQRPYIPTWMTGESLTEKPFSAI